MRRSLLAEKCRSKNELYRILLSEGAIGMNFSVGRFYMPPPRDTTVHFLAQAILEHGSKQVIHHAQNFASC